ncbi:rod shape-determining protein MreD [Gracilibacillus salinarum]|uniref:Rod shape-determining protein MreD n=1 Tax=Gracilibacillus salinarum TaxID=2932255 RepID=A0ABY4GPF9_9BACI|nr:rod shape-determining protein MreD [Gracilibacillus salinarum]UOQ86154.1 rod shape-determining protein MreD [Gracilibacillus salinarum]
MKRMIPYLIALICFLLVILEGIVSLMDLPLVKEDWLVVSHFLFVFLIFVTIFFEKENTFYAITLSIVFSFIIDIIYTDVIGVYVFAYTVILYGVRILMKMLQSNLIIALLMTVIAVTATDILIFFLYNIIQVHDLSWHEYWRYRLIPTVLWNVITGAVMYALLAKRLTRWSVIKFERSDR